MAVHRSCERLLFWMDVQSYNTQNNADNYGKQNLEQRSLKVSLPDYVLLLEHRFKMAKRNSCEWDFSSKPLLEINFLFLRVTLRDARIRIASGAKSFHLYIYLF